MVAKRPEGMDPREWRARRAVYWRRVNRFLNIAMLIAVAVLLWRYLAG